ncbi:MAG TPA: sulfotransferase [Candidatus Cybelea sp.]|jgi:hypothetical protein
MDSRGVIVVGMHRSGTSAVSRGLQALSVHLGDNFFDLAPDNPTGYWEDKTLVALNQRVLEELRLAWDDTELIAYERFRHHRIRLVGLHAVRYLESTLMLRPTWGFKDPRTIRLMPFWSEVFRRCRAQDAYVLAIRHPLSVAGSLFARQQIPLVKAQRVWLAHYVPFLHELRDKRVVVVDYDLLALSPHDQLERIARGLALPVDLQEQSLEIERFATEFLDRTLRHNVFPVDEFDAASEEGRLAHRAYLALYDLATGRREGNANFWAQWSAIQERLPALAERVPASCEVR